jgi:hypothetical protein
MPRQFVAISQDDVDVRIAEALKAREYELASYDFELAGHEAVIAAMNTKHGDWDETTEKYKGLTREQLAKAIVRDGGDEALLMKVSELSHRDAAVFARDAVKIETSKSELHYANLLSGLPEERRAAAFLALKAKEDAQQAKR